MYNCINEAYGTVGKMNIILCEKSYFESNWCRQILSGLKNELKKRRIEYRVTFELDAADEDTTLYIVGSDFRWMSNSVCAANSKGITPIVIFNQLDHMISGRYHSVSSDINGSVSSLVEWLRSRNKCNICLYGINPSSVADISRTQSYLRSSTGSGKTFFNNGSLKKCFEDFRSCGEVFDGVICTNDYAAVSLVKNLLSYDRALLSRADIISCSRSAISECYSEYIRSVDVNFTSLGANAYALSRTLAHGENISEISLTVKWDMSFAKNGGVSEYSRGHIEADGFYDDEELSELLKIDRLLERCDELDRKIINLLLKEKTYLEIADECHLVEQSVKYRVKGYTEICELKGRRELISLLVEYGITL